MNLKRIKWKCFVLVVLSTSKYQYFFFPPEKSAFPVMFTALVVCRLVIGPGDNVQMAGTSAM